VCVCGLWVWGVCMWGGCGCGVCVCVYEDPHAKRVLIFEGFPFVCVVSGCVFVDVVCVCCVCVICVCVGMWCVCVRACAGLQRRISEELTPDCDYRCRGTRGLPSHMQAKL